MTDITLDEARDLRLAHARQQYAPTVEKVMAAIRRAAAMGYGSTTVEVFFLRYLAADERTYEERGPDRAEYRRHLEAAEYAANHLRARGFVARVKEGSDSAGDESDAYEDCSDWIEVTVEWGAHAQWP